MIVLRESFKFLVFYDDWLCSLSPPPPSWRFPKTFPQRGILEKIDFVFVPFCCCSCFDFHHDMEHVIVSSFFTSFPPFFLSHIIHDVNFDLGKWKQKCHGAAISFLPLFSGFYLKATAKLKLIFLLFLVFEKWDFFMPKKHVKRNTSEHHWWSTFQYPSSEKGSVYAHIEHRIC